MFLNSYEIRCLKGYILNELLVSKIIYIIGFIIIYSSIFLSELIQIPMLIIGQSSSNSGGALVTGFGVAYISMLISSILLTRSKAFKSKFVFPLNRKVYTIGNFVVFCVNTFVLLLMSCTAYLFEILLSLVLKSTFNNFIYVNNITFESYSLGFILSLLYIVALTSLSYLFFMLFSRYGTKAISSMSIALGILLMFPFGRNILFGILMFFVGEQSVILLTLKLIVSALLFQLLSYLPIRNMEVNQ